MRAEVQDLTRDEAIILMVESNLQRSNILPSEKAFSYKMKPGCHEATAGERIDLTSAHWAKSDNKSSREF